MSNRNFSLSGGIPILCLFSWLGTKKVWNHGGREGEDWHGSKLATDWQMPPGTGETWKI